MKTYRSGFFRSLFVMAVLAAVMLAGVVIYDSAPHIPMLFGTVLAGAMALISGYTWEEVEEGMVKGMYSSLSSLTILLLIGILTGTWILDGVVPAMVYYGLSLISPALFLPSAMFLCALLSMLVGSWGTIGTIGLAMAGLAQIMGIPMPIAAGAIVSGSYVGDKISPLSDTANLASAITEVNIFENVTHKLYLPLISLAIAAVLFFIIGRQYHGGGEIYRQIEQLQLVLADHFSITPLSFFPLVLLVALMLLRTPAIPSLVAAILAAAFQAIISGGASLGTLLEICMDGYVSSTGVELLDTLLTAGGFNSMLYSVSMILCAMMFSGIMEHTGQMEALMRPVVEHVKSFAGLIAATVGSCILVNVCLPEEFISISIPGALFLDAYDKRGIPRKELAYAAAAAGTSTSSLIPWNTCGVFITGVLGVSPFAYAPFAFYNLLLPVLTILTVLFFHRKDFSSASARIS